MHWNLIHIGLIMGDIGRLCLATRFLVLVLL